MPASPAEIAKFLAEPEFLRLDVFGLDEKTGCRVMVETRSGPAEQVRAFLAIERARYVAADYDFTLTPVTEIDWPIKRA